MSRVQEISQKLEDYTRKNVDGGRAFINMVRASKMNLAFSAVSALGDNPDPETKRMRMDAMRYRVLDPLLWATVLESRGADRSFALIADASNESAPLYEQNLLSALYERLADYGSITTYLLGQTTPISQPGQQPPSAPPKNTHARVIGPLLEQLAPDEQLLVISTGRIRDLEDYYHSRWKDKLLLVELGETSYNDWQNKMFHRDGDDVNVLVQKLLTMGGRS